MGWYSKGVLHYMHIVLLPTFDSLLAPIVSCLPLFVLPSPPCLPLLCQYTYLERRVLEHFDVFLGEVPLIRFFADGAVFGDHEQHPSSEFFGGTGYACRVDCRLQLSHNVTHKHLFACRLCT